MNLIEAEHYKRGTIRGSFPIKPEGYLTVLQWLKKGFIPTIDERDIQVYQMKAPKDDEGYYYVGPQEVRPMTDFEKSRCVIFQNENNKYPSIIAAQPKIKKSKLRFSKYFKSKEEFANIFEYYDKINVIIFDTETTGFKNDDELLQVSIVNKDGDTLLDTYLKPHNKTSWPDAMDVNHITPNMVLNAPFPEDLKNQIQKIFDQCDICIAHNAPFDVKFLYKCMGITIDFRKIIDSLDVFKFLHPELPHHKLENAVDLYLKGKEKSAYEHGAHNSLADTVATAAVFKGMISDFVNKAREGYDFYDFVDKARENYDIER